MPINRQCLDCEDISLSSGPQGPIGPQGNPGVDGNSGSPGADGANILSNSAVDVGTSAAASPQNLRSFTVTPAMLPSNGDVIDVEGYVTSLNAFPAGSIILTFGGVTILSITGIVGNPLIAQEYHFKASITRKGAASQFFDGTASTGVNNQMSWNTKRAHGAGVVDLTVNQNLVLTVATGAGAFAASDLVSKNFKITQILI